MILTTRAMKMAILGTILLAAAGASAELSLPSLFSDHMVIQADAAVKVWGRADAGATVRVAFNSASTEAVANDQGKWMLELPPQKSGLSGVMVVSCGPERVSIADVLVGEVWLASGQSNMAWPLERLPSMPQEAPKANYPALRMFRVARNPVIEGPAEDVQGAWSVATPETVGKFSAVGYFFARSLHQQLGAPVGIINSSVGGTPVESWTSRERLLEIPAIQGHINYLWRLQANWDPEAAEADYQEKLSQWEAQAEQARADGKKEPAKPRAPKEPRLNGWQPASLYNGMIAPLIPYTLRGAIWYQGESNAGRAADYLAGFTTMIQDWRTRWDQSRLPFYFVQLANFNGGRGNWAWLREAQTQTLDALSDTGMAVITDIGDPGNIHPANKQDVGKRLALWAMAKVYGADVVFSGPLYASSRVEGDKMILSFTHAEGLATRDGGKPAGFRIAGEDKKFVDAEAAIVGDTVVVRDPSGRIAAPAAVRYAWSDNPEQANLVNAAGLPASGFRTDDWPRE